MKYFIDTEFIEGFHKPLFGKRRHYIDLISIGIVAEDGREYYAISSEYSEKDADLWVKDNVIHPIFQEACEHPAGLVGFEKEFIKPNKQIADEIYKFVHQPVMRAHYADAVPCPLFVDDAFDRMGFNKHEFYGYYSDYDWVLFCSLFGKMINLPKGFPMYCRDLKQTLDDKANSMTSEQLSKIEYPGVEHNVLAFLGTKPEFDKVSHFKKHQDYPQPTNEHNSLADARWNYKLYKFLDTI